MNANLAALPEGFSYHASGRSGSILYRREARILELYWEMSGVPEYDILLWLEDARTWTHPEKEKIEPDERAQIVKELEVWLWKKKIRSDAFPNSARK
jgi:hypothetical protein